MSSVSEILAIKAMDGLYLRAAAIAENIANSNSRSFHIQTVDFEDALRQATLRGPDALAEFKPSLQRAAEAITGGDVRLDLEMASASATSLRYSALSDILNRQMQLNRLAIRGGQ